MVFLTVAVLATATQQQMGRPKEHRKPSDNRPSAFEPNYEYRYNVETRTVATLPDADERKYAGIATRAELRFCLAPSGTEHNATVHLVGQMINRKYVKIHEQLNNWRSENVSRSYSSVPADETCEKPFSLVFKKGEIQSMYVDKSCYRNAELNHLKGVVSQFQVNLRPSYKNQKLSKYEYTTNNSTSKVFKTMENTVSGDCETHYKVSWVPRQFVNSDWYPVPKSPVEEEDAKFMKITKRKNYDNCKRRIGYNYDAQYSTQNQNDNENHLGNQIGDLTVRNIKPFIL